MPRSADGWTQKLPRPVDFVAGRRRRVLRTLADVHTFLVDELPPKRQALKTWGYVAELALDAAEGRRSPSEVESALGILRMMTPDVKA